MRHDFIIQFRHPYPTVGELHDLDLLGYGLRTEDIADKLEHLLWVEWFLDEAENFLLTAPQIYEIVHESLHQKELIHDEAEALMILRAVGFRCCSAEQDLQLLCEVDGLA